MPWFHGVSALPLQVRMVSREPRCRLSGSFALHAILESTAKTWEVGFMWDSDPRFAKPLIAALAKDGLLVGDNEPHDGALVGDTLDEAVTSRGLAGRLSEVRQDLVASNAHAVAFADRLARLLRPILARPELHCEAFFPSRTGRHV